MADSREGEARAAAAGAPSGRRAGSGRVVVSGMGAVSAAGMGAQELWRAARDGASQVRELRTEIPYDGRIKIAAQVPPFEPSAHIEASLLPFCDPFTQYRRDRRRRGDGAGGPWPRRRRRPAHGRHHRHRHRRHEHHRQGALPLLRAVHPSRPADACRALFRARRRRRSACDIPASARPSRSAAPAPRPASRSGSACR